MNYDRKKYFISTIAQCLFEAISFSFTHMLKDIVDLELKRDEFTDTCIHKQ